MQHILVLDQNFSRGKDSLQDKRNFAKIMLVCVNKIMLVCVNNSMAGRARFCGS
jgi:hypothetical protein